MKTFEVVVLIVGLAIASVSAMNKDEAKAMFRDMSQECKETEKASDDDVETMINENYPESKEGKCLVACMQEQFQIVVEKKFHKENFMGLAAMGMGGKEDKMKKVEEIADECKEVSHEDRCEQAILIGKCMEEGAKKRGLNAENMMDGEEEKAE